MREDDDIMESKDIDMNMLENSTRYGQVLIIQNQKI